MRGAGKGPSHPLVVALLGAALFGLTISVLAIRPVSALAAPLRTHPHPSPTPTPPQPSPTPRPTPSPTPRPTPTPTPSLSPSPPPSPSPSATPAASPSPVATAADPGPTVLEAASAGLTATGSTSALPQTGSGLPAVVGPTDPGSALVVWIVLAVVAIPGTMVMALIALVLVRR